MASAAKISHPRLRGNALLRHKLPNQEVLPLDMRPFPPLLIGVQSIPPPDSHHLSAALGWLGLGAVADACQELANVSAENAHHPATLEVRWAISAYERDWVKALEISRIELARVPEEPSGWLHRAYALRRASENGLPEAWESLLPAADKFPDEPVIPYNLACYACQMQQIELAREWFHRAMSVGKKSVIKQMALNDDDLQTLWPEIRKL